MSELTSHHDIEVSSERSFGFVFAGFFALVGLWPLLTAEGKVRGSALLVAAAFLTVALLVPIALKPLNLLWFKLGALLGVVMTPVVMFLIFAVAVVPTALVLRIARKDPMNRRTDASSASYWIERDSARSGSMRDQF